MAISREEAQRRVDAVNSEGSIRAAARFLDMNYTALLHSLATAKKHYGLEPTPKLVLRAATVNTKADGELIQRWDKMGMAGLAEEDTATIPDPKKLIKTSKLYDGSGNVVLHWATEKPEDITRERLWLEFAESLAKPIPPADPVPVPTTECLVDLLAVYPIADQHIGMLSWHKETGEDYDLPISSRLLTGAIDFLTASLPPCDECLIPFLGDFFHYDSTKSVTPEHGNHLDADGRFHKMVDVGVTLAKYVIMCALRRHKRVRVIFEPGNHDPYSTACLIVLFKHLYANEPRVSIDTGAGTFHYYEFGLNLVGTHHGDKCKMADLPGVMADQMPEAWGRTKHRLWLTGHVHHEQRHGFRGCVVESLKILPPPDAWAAGKGLGAPRGMIALGLHRERGETMRYTVVPDMFR